MQWFLVDPKHPWLCDSCGKEVIRVFVETRDSKSVSCLVCAGYPTDAQPTTMKEYLDRTMKEYQKEKGGLTCPS